ncbi:MULTISPECIES: FxDxF family PEP-CTERM protein [unclassified Janthinobacterium]|uniref:FxDxF family PEP-CTERM protein n=1 Tax=unclassified Janthinobacterium TaxID=2610881 RepID=UPI0012F8B580|nr:MULTISPECIES: FxDxF family PEP-CTERM protein [unclassified Janthinobacterium]MEC5163366.1 MYXO-CTERM domain-containing protein [Janthinobacterium sp. CG_S6]
MKKIVHSVLLAVLFAATSLARAGLVDLSQDPVFITQDLLNFSSANLGHTVALDKGAKAGASGNYFSDKYYFTTGEVYDLSSLITSLRPGASQGLTLTGFELRNANGIVFHGTQDISAGHPADEQAWSFSSVHPLEVGFYFIEINGYVASANGGSYGGNVAVASVPEADTYAMLLAGLGLLGFTARRRRAALRG